MKQAPGTISGQAARLRRQLTIRPSTPHWLPALALLLLTAGQGLAVAEQRAPSIRLFPTTVVENVKDTGRVARDMEASLQDVIGKLEQQWKLYRESKCEGAQGDPGCDQISRQLGDQYLQMLSLMDDQLPQMERSIKATVNSLERRLHTELGQKLTARELQDLVLRETSAGRTPQLANANERTSGRLSKRFRQYYKLVAQANPSARGSIALVAADIYLDSKQVLELIRLTEDEVSRSRIMMQLRNELGTVTPEMAEVVNGVKNVLFGEQAVPAPEATPPTDSFPKEYESPLAY